MTLYFSKYFRVSGQEQRVSDTNGNNYTDDTQQIRDSNIDLESVIPDVAIGHNKLPVQKDINEKEQYSFYSRLCCRRKPDSLSMRRLAYGLFAFNILFFMGVFIVTNFIGEIAMIGDSLVVGPDNHHDLIKYIQQQAEIGSTPVDYGHYGYEIADLIKLCNALPFRFNTNMFVKSAILFWDSDVSNVDESVMDQQQVLDIRKKYKENVKYLASQLLASGRGTHLAISGPGVLGSDGMYQGTNKTSMLNDYVEINKSICRELKIPYVNIRRRLLESIEKGENPTRDGEHLNDLGIQICGDVFIKVFKRFRQRWDPTADHYDDI